MTVTFAEYSDWLDESDTVEVFAYAESGSDIVAHSDRTRVLVPSPTLSTTLQPDRIDWLTEGDFVFSFTNPLPSVMANVVVRFNTSDGGIDLVGTPLDMPISLGNLAPGGTTTLTLQVSANTVTGDYLSVVMTADNSQPTQAYVPVEVRCFGDGNFDNVVDFADTTAVLGNFGLAGPDGDTNYDGIVQFADLTLALTNWGRVCE